LKLTSRSSTRIASRVLKGIASIFTIARNSVYKAADLTKALVRICTQNKSAEQCSNPSPDVVLRRLRQVGERDFTQVWRRMNTGLLRRLAFRWKVIMALDFKTLPYYGVVQSTLVGDSRLPGTRFGMRFAMLSVVENGRTFVLGVKQATPFSSKVGILREMLGRTPLKPRMLLLDRGFYSVGVIKALESMRTHFLMRAKRTAPIKRLCKLFERGEIPPVVKYSVRSSGDSVPVWLIFIRKRTKRGWKTHVFVSDLPFDPGAASELYRCRWRIETNNRELKKFMARTTSPSMKLRRIYYSLAALLYNFWIVMRDSFGELRSYEFKRILVIILNAAVPSVTFGRGPDPPP